ncbi:MAG: hypothetical protein E7640_05320 [Ruminococcaceae bacterium]|nr:hypothetical protein [Oscillospiraceae bacterium]
MNDDNIIQEPSPDIEGELRARIAQLEGELAELTAKGERERAEREEFLHIFPNVDPDHLPDGALKLREGGLPLSAAYALYDRIRENEISAARAASAKNAALLHEKINGGGETFFSADEVRGMSAREVRSNFKSIMRSMKHWAK